MNNKSSLCYYKAKSRPKMEEWIKDTVYNSMLLKARTGNLEIGSTKGKQSTKNCRICNNEEENIEHLLWECVYFLDAQTIAFKKLREILGSDWDRASIFTKTTIMLDLNEDKNISKSQRRQIRVVTSTLIYTIMKRLQQYGSGRM